MELSDFKLANGVKPERNGTREIHYSAWHRQLSSKCVMMDIDCLEIRGERIVAIIEEKDIDGELRNFQDKVLSILARALPDIPIYFVRHNLKDAKTANDIVFKVFNYRTNELEIMDDTQYRQLIENLGE